MKLFSSPLRPAMEDVFRSVERELVIVSPYIKESETRSLNERFKSGQRDKLKLSVLTDVSADSVLCGALDVSALHEIAEIFPRATVTTLPRLHAKVYIADSRFALVTSANFTRPWMDLN